MSDRNRFSRLVEEVDVALAEQRHLRARGVHLIVTHLDHVAGTACAQGEMIGDIALGGSPEPITLGLSHMSLLLMDCFCRYRTPLSALRVQQIMNTDPFYIDYAANRIGHNQVIAKPGRHSVRTYVNRIRKQMERVFREIALPIDPHQILLSETTDLNVIVYRLKATCEFVHC